MPTSAERASNLLLPRNGATCLCHRAHGKYDRTHYRIPPKSGRNKTLETLYYLSSPKTKPSDAFKGVVCCETLAAKQNVSMRLAALPRYPERERTEKKRSF